MNASPQFADISSGHRRHFARHNGQPCHLENHSGHPCHLDATASIAFMIDAAFVLGRNLPKTERPTENAYARDPSFAAARCPRLRRIHSLRGVFAAIARYSIALAAYSSCLQLHHIHHPLPTASPQLPATPRPSPHAISGRIMDQARRQKPRSLMDETSERRRRRRESPGSGG